MKRSDVAERRRPPRARHVAVTATVLARRNQTAPFAVENLSAPIEHPVRRHATERGAT